jgi:Stage II sporulation protein E (SpoIIE)
VSSAPSHHRLPAVVLIVALAVFFGLAAACRVLYNQTENRLLRQRTSEAGAAIQISVNQIRSPLDAAAKLAAATGGDTSSFEKILAPYVGTDKTFTSAALFKIGSTTSIAQVGIPFVLPVDGPNSATSMLADATKSPFAVVDLLGGDKRRLGYAVADAVTQPQFVVYGERTLSVDPNVRRRTDEPFAQLDYAIYLGTTPSTDHLLGASLRDLPIRGRNSAQGFAFGNTQLLLVMTPIGHLSGNLFANLWWIVALGGIVVSVAFALLTRGLLQRRDTALGLAADNERLYDEQRHIAETLQLGLLPQHLVAPEGVSVAARYWPAGSANLIGGDFYDLFAADGNRWGLAIGDVCGKGIEAAALTGLARHTLRAAARHPGTPVDVLRAVHQAMRDHRPATFCTACFAYIYPTDGASFRVELSLGGHPQPLLHHRSGAVESVGALGMLLGMMEPTLSTTVLELEPGETLVFYTDGLTDAPAEEAVSEEELATLLTLEGDRPIEELADSIRALKRGRRPQGSGDDTALLIVRFDGTGTPSNVNGTSDEPARSGGTR